MTTYRGSNPIVIARIAALGARIERRRAYGKPVRALESQVDRLIREAHARERH